MKTMYAHNFVSTLFIQSLKRRSMNVKITFCVHRERVNTEISPYFYLGYHNPCIRKIYGLMTDEYYCTLFYGV